MIKHMTRHGNSLALVIDRGVLDLLKITPETPLSITTDGQGLHVYPVKEDARQKTVRAAYSKMSKKYEKALRKLAE
jgi:antitoxin MazE